MRNKTFQKFYFLIKINIIFTESKRIFTLNSQLKQKNRISFNLKAKLVTI